MWDVNFRKAYGRHLFLINTKIVDQIIFKRLVFLSILFYIIIEMKITYQKTFVLIF